MVTVTEIYIKLKCLGFGLDGFVNLLERRFDSSHGMWHEIVRFHSPVVRHSVELCLSYSCS